MRFRKRAKLFPGVYINFSGSGISTTVGVPGLSLSLSKRGTYLNTSIPGTGLYDRQRIDGGGRKEAKNSIVVQPQVTEPSEEIGAIRTEQAEATTTEGLQDLKKTLLDCYQERVDLQREIAGTKNKLLVAKILLVLSYIFIIGFFVKWFKKNKDEKQEYLNDLQTQLGNCFVNIDMDIDSKIETQYARLLDSYKEMLSSTKIWDVTSSVSVDRAKTRSAASSAITRRPVKFGFNNIDIVKSKYDALHFENANGGDLYIYPAFIAVVDAHKKFGLVDIRELDFNFHSQKFLEEEKVPSDAQLEGYTWAKVNKSGGPDKRYKDNHQIPICLYGEFSLTSNSGLNESYMLSNNEKSEKFASAMIGYQSTFK